MYVFSHLGLLSLPNTYGLSNVCVDMSTVLHIGSFFQLENVKIIYMQDQVATEVMLRHIVHLSLCKLPIGPPAACLTVIYEVLLYNQVMWEESYLSGQNFTFHAHSQEFPHCKRK